MSIKKRIPKKEQQQQQKKNIHCRIEYNE